MKAFSKLQLSKKAISLLLQEAYKQDVKHRKDVSPMGCSTEPRAELMPL